MASGGRFVPQFPVYPAATTFGNHLCPPNADAIMRALAPVIPHRVTAGWQAILDTVRLPEA